MAKMSPLRAIAMGVVSMQYGPALSVYGAYVMIYSPKTPGLTILITVVLMLGVAKVITFFAHRHVGSGGILTYIARDSGRRTPAYLATAGLFSGYVAVLGSTVTATSVFVTGVLYNLGVKGAAGEHWQLVILVLIAVCTTAVCHRGLEASFWVAATLGLACVPVVVWVMIQYSVKHGVHFAPLYSLSGFDLTSTLLGVVFLSSAFIGFDALATLASDTEEPRRNVPRILNAVVLAGVPVLVLSLLVESPIANTDAFAAGDTVSSIMAKQGGVGWMAIPVDVLISASMIAAAVAFQSFAGRFFATMGSVGLLPRGLSVVDPQRGTPKRANLVAGALSLAIPVATAMLLHGSPADATVYLGAAIGYSWGYAYIVVALVAVVVVARRARNHWPVAVAGALAAAGFIAFEANGLRDGFKTADSTQSWICAGAVVLLAAGFLLVRKIRGTEIDLTAIDDVE
ncbi:APC family permease [Catenulispora rubra]|uniref:APC family permease n=1 Tax=Catenulispora rubra TaxID=280293 RepID=UPI0018926896|nr:APC family permease [Catenulispora rubra]